MRRIRGFKDFVFDTVDEITGLVEKTHATTIQRTARRAGLLPPLSAPAEALGEVTTAGAAGVYATIRAVNEGIRIATDAAGEAVFREAWHAEGESLLEATPSRSDAAGSLPWLIDHAESAINGILGSRLLERQNRLAIEMTFRRNGRPLRLEREHLAATFPDATRRIVIFVHGLCCTEWSWSLHAERFHGDPTINYGSLLEADAGFTPFYVRYNTGRHVSDNGKQLSELVERLIEAYPEDVDEVVLIGHSMGGLVARSAAYYAERNDRQWSRLLRHVFCLASPNLGAPLEKATNVLSGVLKKVGSAGADVPADLLDMRSHGIKDLRFGYTVDDEWQDADPDAVLEDRRQRIPFIDGVGYYFVACTVTEDPSHDIGMALGDLLVRLPSAAGHHPEPARRIPFTSGAIFGGMHHFTLANHPAVYDVIRRCLQASPALPELPAARPLAPALADVDDGALPSTEH